MTLSLPAALRAMAWLLTPWHFLLVYTLEALELGLALVGAAALLRQALRRHRIALTALALSSSLTAAPPRPRLPLQHGALYRVEVRHHRVVHRAHQPETPHQTAATPSSYPAGATDPQPARGTIAAQLSPEHRRVFDAALAAAEAHAPVAIPTPRRLPVSERQLRIIANDQVIGPMIAACRQAARSAR